MDIAELRKMKPEDIDKALAEARATIQTASFNKRAGSVDVKALRTARKTIARILTLRKQSANVTA